MPSWVRIGLVQVETQAMQYQSWSSKPLLAKQVSEYIFWWKYDLNSAPCTSSSTQLGFKLVTSRLWQYISCHWGACSNHSAISDDASVLELTCIAPASYNSYHHTETLHALNGSWAALYRYIDLYRFTKLLEVNLFADCFCRLLYRLFPEDFSLIYSV